MKTNLSDINGKFSEAAKNIGDLSKKSTLELISTSKDLSKRARTTVEESKNAIFNAIDLNGNGEIDIEDVIIMGLRVPGIKIDRADFLHKELFKNHPDEVIQKAIDKTPAIAGVPKEEIDKIADEVINNERLKVSGISTALGTPGGVAMVATIPADIAQYYGYMLRAAQKLMYLYGFPQIDVEEKESKFDSETLNILTLCLGAMYGVAGANNALKAVANALAKGVEKQLLNKALTKGVIYPIVKSVAKWFGVNMTKQIFAGAFKKAIPVLGGVIGGGLTFATFKPCCDRLKASLQDTMLSNPNGYTPTHIEENINNYINSGKEFSIPVNIKYFKTDREDYFVTDGRKWLYYDGSPFCIRMEEITDVQLLPTSMEEIVPVPGGVHGLPLFNEGTISINDYDGSEIGQHLIKNRIIRMEYVVSYSDVLNVIAGNGKDESFQEKYIFYRDGSVKKERYETRATELKGSEEYHISYDQAMNIFDEVEHQVENICGYSADIDDYGGSVKLIYDNGKIVEVSKGTKSQEGHLVCKVDDFCIEHGFKQRDK